MKKPLIAHEAPYMIMREVQQMTDYDYCLVHLLEEDPKYLEYFREAKEKGRYIIMDCSLFELGHAFNPELYYNWIKEIQPDEYIVPDVWQDYEDNLRSFKAFSELFDLTKLKGKRIGVLQGRTYREFINAYQFMEKECDKIAVSFGYDYFWDNHSEDWKDNPYWKDTEYTLEFEKTVAKPTSYASGRNHLIKSLISSGVWNKNKPHHLLGCGIPTEFETHFEGVESIDTSHPVMTGFFGKSYKNIESTYSKIHNKMVDVYDAEVDLVQRILIKENIELFSTLL